MWDGGAYLSLHQNRNSTMDIFEKILPNQVDNKKLYGSKEPIIEDQIVLLAQELIDWTEPTYEHSDKSQFEMGSSIFLQDILNLLIRLTSASRVLEIGTFVGMSAISFAKNNNVTVDTIEKYQSFADTARRNIQANNLDQRINVIVGDARDIMPTLQATYDLIFIDGDKEHYLDYFKMAAKKLSAKGLIIVDDIFFHGDVFNKKPLTSRGLGVKVLINYLKEVKTQFQYRIIPISNGVLIASVR